MNNSKIIEWVLRIVAFGSFFGHGMFAIQGKEGWFKVLRDGFKTLFLLQSLIFDYGCVRFHKMSSL